MKNMCIDVSLRAWKFVISPCLTSFSLSCLYFLPKSQPITYEISLEWKTELNLQTKTTTRGSEFPLSWTSSSQTWSAKSRTTTSKRLRKYLILQTDPRLNVAVWHATRWENQNETSEKKKRTSEVCIILAGTDVSKPRKLSTNCSSSKTTLWLEKTSFYIDPRTESIELS